MINMMDNTDMYGTYSGAFPKLPQPPNIAEIKNMTEIWGEHAYGEVVTGFHNNTFPKHVNNE